MKKVVILSAMALLSGSLMFTSCSKKKDWNCKCTLTSGGQSVNSGGPIMDAKEDDAEKACQAVEDQANSVLPGSTNCTLEEQ